MSFTQAVAQQWHKAEMAEMLMLRLQSQHEVRQLLVGATSLQTVCHLVAALAFAEQTWKADEWDDNQLVAMFCCAFQLLFVKAIQQPLPQGEELIISLGSRLAAWLPADKLSELARQQTALMHQSAAQLMELRRHRRQASRNMR
ncbi:hypothetical protein HR45_09420 [Shewanella mangrovi]|uniref:Uncharacterized protein n=1 Tax=Shewanella mangrovi TaxID=1515746 RepID=A0A094JEF1_9GAMM|nr:hypothetical protein [Shewanella mangrovi]KFZ37632.1 hypothetical protein HR45_09420 [Shewanella mangrovi]